MCACHRDTERERDRMWGSKPTGLGVEPQAATWESSTFTSRLLAPHTGYLCRSYIIIKNIQVLCYLEKLFWLILNLAHVGWHLNCLTDMDRWITLNFFSFFCLRGAWAGRESTEKPFSTGEERTTCNLLASILLLGFGAHGSGATGNSSCGQSCGSPAL